MTGKIYYLQIIQDAVGGRTVTWDSQIRWPDGSAPTLSTTPYASDVFQFYSDGFSLFAEAVKKYPPQYTVFSDFALPTTDFSTLLTTTSMPSGGLITRSGNAMLYDSTGKLTYAPNNIVQHQSSYDTSVWAYGTSPGALSANSIVAPDGATTAAAYTWGTTVSDIGWLRVRPSGTFNASTALIYSIWIKVPSGTKSFRMAISDWNATTSNSSNRQATTVWQRFSYAIPAGTLTNTGNIAAALFTASAGSTDGIAAGDVLHVWGPQLEAVTYQTTPSGTYYVNYPTPNTTAAYYGPRFDYDPSTLAAKGLLVEGTRTNNLPGTNTFSGWSGVGSPSPTTSNVAPDGTATAYSWGGSGSTGYFKYVALSATTQYTFSIYVKNISGSAIVSLGGADAVWGGASGTSAANLRFNTSTKAFSNIGAGIQSYGYQDVGNGWMRVYIVATTNSAPGATVGFSAYVIGATTFAALWGAQVEAGAFASSYVPNTATSGTITRAAETFTISGYANRLVEAYWIDQQTGVSSSFPETVVSSGSVTINPPTFGWVTSLRTYTNAYAGDIPTPSWIDNSGTTGNRMYTDSTGTLTWAPTNLLLRSQDFSATWTLTNATRTAGQTDPNSGTAAETLTSSSANATIRQGVTTVADPYVFSVWLKRTTGTGNIDISVDGTTWVTQTITSSWARYFVRQTGVAGTSNPGIRIVASGDAVDVFGAQLERVTYQTQPRAYIPTTTAAVYQPRYDYDPSVVPAQPRGMLIEESRANLLTYSQDFSNSVWNKTGLPVTVSTSAIADPAGGTGAFLVVPTTSSSSQRAVFQSLAFTSGASYTLSFYVKPAGYNIIRIGAGSFGLLADINLSTSSITNIGVGTTASLTAVGNGWFRASVTFTASGPSSSAAIQIKDNSNNLSFTGDGTSGIFIWGAQLEAGSFATSYIPTVASSVTRVADVVRLTGSALTTLQGSAFSALVEANLLTVSGTPVLLGNAGTLAMLYVGSNTQAGSFDSTASPNVIGPANSGSGTFLTVARAGVSSNSASGRTVVIGNGTVAAAANAISASRSVIRVGAYDGGSQPASGWYRSFAAYNQKLPDAILKQKSAVNAPY